MMAVLRDLLRTLPDLPEQVSTLSALRGTLANGYLAILILVILSGQIHQALRNRRER